MAVLNFVFSAQAGMTSATTNDQATLITAADDAVTAADAANVSNDATTEIAAIQTAIDAIEANQPAGACVISIDTSLVTTKNQLRTILKAVDRYLTESTNTLA